MLTVPFAEGRWLMKNLPASCVMSESALTNNTMTSVFHDLLHGFTRRRLTLCVEFDGGKR